MWRGRRGRGCRRDAGPGVADDSSADGGVADAAAGEEEGEPLDAEQGGGETGWSDAGPGGLVRSTPAALKLMDRERVTLSPRQAQALQHMWDGLTMKEAANVTGLSVRYVHNVRLTIFRKLGAHSVVQAVRRGLELGLLGLEP